MEQRDYQVTLTGKSDSLMHAYNFEYMHDIDLWRKHPDNQKKKVAGDDRSPAFTWIGCLNHDGKRIGWPSDNLMTMIRDAATMIVISGKKTFKAQSQSGMMVNEILWPIKTNGNEIPWEPIHAMIGVEDFDKHMKVAKELGFSLFLKPAIIGRAKHIRVRPRFSNWTVQGTVSVFDDMITTQVLQSIFDIAGIRVGLSDWRPKSPRSPGQFGQFTAEVKQI